MRRRAGKLRVHRNLGKSKAGLAGRRQNAQHRDRSLNALRFPGKSPDAISEPVVLRCSRTSMIRPREAGVQSVRYRSLVNLKTRVSTMWKELALFNCNRK